MRKNNKQLQVGISIMAAVFFIFGFVSSLNNILIPKLQEVFELSNAKAQLVNLAFFISYFLFSIPSGRIIKKTGYKNGVIIGVLIIGLGSLLFYPAALSLSYPMFLGAIFVLAIGVVFLQTVANPYVASLGDPETASGRLNLVQAINSIAVTSAPMIGGFFFFRNVAENLDKVASAKTVIPPFIYMAVILLLVAVIIKLVKLPSIIGKDEKTSNGKSVWKYPHVVMGAFAIFAYVGCEIGCASFIKQYIGELQIDMEAYMAAKYVAIYWGGMMIGRFFGSIALSDIKSKKRILYSFVVVVFAFGAGLFITRDIMLALVFFVLAVINYFLIRLGSNKANKTLTVFTLAAITLIIVSVVSSGMVAIWAICAIGFFNSIMFPNIFALSVKGLSNVEMAIASGIINTLIVGGAIVPVTMGFVADSSSIQLAYLVPLVCYLYVLFFALKGSRVD